MVEFKRLLAYFQGTSDPKKDKGEKGKDPTRKLDKARFNSPLFKNYDYVKNETGPGAGYSSLQNYDSVAEFLKAKRKRNKDTKKADDQTKSDQRQWILSKLAIDFPTDEQAIPILSDNGTYESSVPIGGRTDDVSVPQNDPEDKKLEEPDFGRYEDDPKLTRIDRLLDQYLTPKEPGLLGRSDKVVLEEELDPSETKSDTGQNYGNTDSGNTTFSDHPII